jgi:hypothetical protein
MIILIICTPRHTFLFFLLLLLLPLFSLDGLGSLGCTHSELMNSEV